MDEYGSSNNAIVNVVYTFANMLMYAFDKLVFGEHGKEV
jgi:hypothetical protein